MAEAQVNPADWGAVEADGPAAWGATAVDQPVTAGGLAKAAGAGLVKGTTMLGGMYGDLQEIGGKVADYVKPYLPTIEADPESEKLAAKFGSRGDVSPLPRMPRSAEIQKSIEPVTGPLHEPQNRPERYAETVAEFVPSAAMGPLRTGAGAVSTGINAVRKVGIQAAVPGLASEAAGEATKGTPLEPFARGLAALAGGVGGGLLTTPKTVERALQRQLPEYVTDQHITRAGQVIEAAANRGIDLTWPEALSQVTGKPVLTDMQRILESAGRTRAKMQDVLAPRPEQFDRAAMEELHTIAPGTAEPSMTGPNAAAVANDTLHDVRKIINAHTDPFYAAASTVRLTPQEMTQVRAIPGYQEARDAIRGDPQLNRNVANLSEDSVGFLNEVKKYFDQQGSNAGSKLNPGANQQRATGYSQSAAAVKQAGVNASPAYDVALTVQADTRQKYLEPLLQGPLGKLADAPDTKRAIDALFPTQPLANSHNEVGQAVSALAIRRPAVASELVRAHLEGAFNEATQRLVGGQNQFGAAKFGAAIAGNPQQRENLKAAIESLPNGLARWRSFEEFLDIAQATGNRQAIGSKTAFNDQELHRMEKGGPITEAAKLAGSPSKWFSAVNDKVSAWQYGRNLDELARVITDPRSGALLQKVASSPRGSREFYINAARLFAQANVSTQGRAGPSAENR